MVEPRAAATATTVSGTATATLRSVAMAVPDRRVTNREIADSLGVDEAWIAKRTGTHERPWAQPGERMSTFAARAGAQALERAGIPAGDLDLVLVATSTADEITPNAAPLVAGRIDAERAGALDVGSACTGWLAALAMACGQIESGRARHALVVGADFLSQFLDLSDRDTTPLFADGAGAAVISASGNADTDGNAAADGNADTDGNADAAGKTDTNGNGGGRIGPVLLRSDAGGAELIRLARNGRIEMRGRETFKAAVESLSAVTEEVLDHEAVALEDVDLFVYHQANSRIIRSVGRLGLAPERVVDYVDRFANSSTATLPIALTVAEQEGRLRPGDRVLLAAFGGGFTWGATLLRWPCHGPAQTR